MIKKTRNLSLFEYLEILQLEYINAELRKKIYPIKKDKRFYARTMSYKKEKIEDISSRNNLPTIFNDERVKSSLYEKIYTTEYGLPNFLYRNRQEIEEFRKWDIINYFAKEAEIRVRIQDEVKVGIIIDNSFIIKEVNKKNIVIDPDILSCTVKIKGDSLKTVSLIKYINRIL